MLKKAIKKRWLKALRTGKYKQTPGKLCRPKVMTSDLDLYDAHYQKNGTIPAGYCCLGVLCDLFINSKAGKEAVASWRDDGAFLIKGKKKQTGALPKIVVEWAFEKGVKDNNVENMLNSGCDIVLGEQVGWIGESDIKFASDYNDGECQIGVQSFKQIARRIETRL